MRQHPFFKMISWTHLERKLISPPVILNMDDEDEELKDFGN